MDTGIKGVSSMKLRRDLGIAQSSAWHLAHRIRESWEKSPQAFAGPIEVDETYIGGKEKNKHAHKKLRAGRGTVGKTAVAGAKDPSRPTTRMRTASGSTDGKEDTATAAKSTSYPATSRSITSCRSRRAAAITSTTCSSSALCATRRRQRLARRTDRQTR